MKTPRSYLRGEFDSFDFDSHPMERPRSKKPRRYRRAAGSVITIASIALAFYAIASERDIGVGGVGAVLVACLLGLAIGCVLMVDGDLGVGE